MYGTFKGFKYDDKRQEVSLVFKRASGGSVLLNLRNSSFTAMDRAAAAAVLQGEDYTLIR